MSALSVEFEDLFVGRPDQLEPRADALVTAAEAIARATESLRAIVDGQTSQSTDAIAQTSSEVARSLSRARRRYRDTGTALQTYAVELRPIQRDARDALSTAEYYEQRTYSLPHDISDREGDLVRAQASEASPAAIASSTFSKCMRTSASRATAPSACGSSIRRLKTPAPPSVAS